MNRFLLVCSQVVCLVVGLTLNNVTLVHYSGYKVIVPIAVAAFLGVIGMTFLTWRRQSKPGKIFSIVVVLACI